LCRKPRPPPRPIPGVPEPSTWVMLVIGTGAVGGLVRRRRTKPAVRFPTRYGSDGAGEEAVEPRLGEPRGDIRDRGALGP
jgi:hypothetical protein